MAVKGAKGKAGRVAVWAILALLIVGLAGFGATNFGGNVQNVGRVGEVEITVDDYARALQNELQRLSQQTGQSLTLAQAQAFGLDRAILQRLVGQAALTNEAQRIGLSVGDEQVRREIVAIPAFQGVDGAFDREGYAFVLERSGLTPAEFEEEVRDDTARRLLQSAISGGVVAPPTFVDTLYAYAREARDISWVTLQPGDLEQPVGDPTEDQVQAFYEANPELFTAPEAREITYAWITPEMLTDEIEVEEDAVRELYEVRADEYRQPERRLVERLVFADEAAAQAAAERIAAGETTFDALVEERDLAPEDVDLGEVSRADLGAAADAVFALEQPGIAGPTPSPLGPALYRVNAVLPAQETPFEEVRDELRAELAADRARAAIEDMSREVEDLLAGGATLEELAGETPLQIGQLDLGPETAEGPAAYATFREAVAAVTVEDFPELQRLEDGGIFALRLDEVRPPQLSPLEEVRDAVIEAWRADRLQQALMAEAEALAARLDEGATFDELGYLPESATGVLRDGLVQGLPQEGVAAAFELQPGGASALTADGEVAVVRLDEVTPADTEDEEARAAKQAFADRTAQTIATDLVEAFVRAAERDAGISLDQSAINAVHAQLP